MKAKDLKPGHVLVDPEGHLYEVVAIDIRRADMVHAWLWPDSSTAPNYWQTFQADEDVVSIGQGGTDGEPDSDGTAE